MSFGENLQRHFRRSAGDGKVRPVAGSAGDEFATRLPEAEPITVEAEVVEGGILEQRDVPAADASGFTHFLDGVQKSRVVLTYEFLPVLRAFVAASVRARGADRRMFTFGDLVRTREALVMPFDLCPPGRFIEDGLECLDSTPAFPRDLAPAERDHPAIVREAAHRAVGSARTELEQALTREWCGVAGPLDWLLVDGAIPVSLDIAGSERVVGLIKSHQTRYFTGEEYRRILDLPAGSRTSVFRTRRGSFQSAYSWYVRLREDRAQDPAFGLVRVEAKAGPAAIQQADSISAWILAERSPVSLPDSRWDRMIYPIRDCEQYLKAISPSQVEMEARLV